MLVWRGKDMKNNKYIKREKKQRPISDFNLALSLPNEEGARAIDKRSLKVTSFKSLKCLIYLTSQKVGLT